MSFISCICGGTIEISVILLTGFISSIVFCLDWALIKLKLKSNKNKVN